MIIVLFGQPHSGKSTIANEILKQTTTYVNIDGDKLRELFVNKDYSKEGRIKNLNRASDIAHYLNSTGKNVILSLVYPYKEARDYLRSLNNDVCWVHLTYKGERGRESYHVKDFEPPLDENVLQIDTSSLSLSSCLQTINSYVNAKRFSKSIEQVWTMGNVYWQVATLA
jgi:adenylylsulfate kinase-like enzyme